ncbi:major facilitator superfamily domain-containing protein [Nemania sp. FL0031]|nr:major facilitator superfamily domain-containing protein [Nemania sp. FL0031]
MAQQQHQMAKVEIGAIAPPTRGSDSSSSSAPTSVDGQVTPASGSVSGRDVSEREGIVVNQGRGGRGRGGGGYSRDHHMLSDSDSDSDDGDGKDREMYELTPLAGDASRDRGRDGGYSSSNSDDDDDDDDSDDDGKAAYRTDGRNRKYSERRRSDSTVASFQLYTPDEERAVVRKFDRRLVIFLAFCYMLSFVDRSNIGNARIAGMETDLQTKPPREDYFAWALRAFYITYITFEWMSLLWRLIPAHIYVSLVVLSWGIIASLQALATSYTMLIALRLLLGIGEAGFAGVPFYLSFFFKRRELAFRTALFISAAPLASTFAGFLAWLILWAGKNSPIAPWRLLFLLEGFPSIIVATIAWGVIPDSPETAAYLTPRERKIALLRLRHEKGQQHGRSSSLTPPSLNANSTAKAKAKASPSTRGLKLRDALAAFKDPKAWLTAFMLFLANMAYSTLPAFLPTILKDMGHSELQAEALSAPPNLLAFAIVLLTAHVSDRAQSRSPFIAAHALLSASGYLVLALARRLGEDRISPMVRYVAVTPAAVGFFSVVVLVIAWAVNNQPDEGRRGGGFALLQVVGQCGPLLGAQLYPDRDAPFFETGMWACCAAMAGVAVLALVLRAYLAWLNRRLDKEEGKGEGGEGGDEEEVRELVGEGRRRERMGFRYML